MKMKPIGDLVLLELDEIKEKTKSGIILMDNKTGYITAKVSSIGPGLFTQTGNRIPMSVKSGDTILISKNNLGSQKKIKFDGVEYILVREMEISMVSN